MIKQDYSADWKNWKVGDKFVVDNSRLSDFKPVFKTGDVVTMSHTGAYVGYFNGYREYNQVMIPLSDWEAMQEMTKEKHTNRIEIVEQEDGEFTIRNKVIPHNIEPGDWTCYQNDKELFDKLVKAFENAGFVSADNYVDFRLYPLIAAYTDDDKLLYECIDTVDVDMVNYRTPEYILTAANAQPKPKSQEEIEIEEIVDMLVGFNLWDDNAEYAGLHTLMHKGGFRVSNLKNGE